MFLSHSGDKASALIVDTQKLDLRQLEPTAYKPKPAITEKLKCDVASLIASESPAVMSLSAGNGTMLNINDVERTDSDSEVTKESPLWASLEKKGTRKWNERISTEETETEQENLDGG